MPAEPYYRTDLARVHGAGFGFHADRCAPGILRILAGVRARDGVVLELGCGAGALTRHLRGAGHRVIATDASPAMLALAGAALPDVDVRRLCLPVDPIPPCDAVVSVGHVLNYLPDGESIDRALIAAARAIRPGGVLAIDLCDIAFAAAHPPTPGNARLGEDWAIIVQTSIPAPNRYVRDMSTFVRLPDGTWRRDSEVHENVLVDVSRVPGLLARHGLDAAVGPAFGAERLPEGLLTVVGRRPSAAPTPPGATPDHHPGPA